MSKARGQRESVKVGKDPLDIRTWRIYARKVVVKKERYGI